MGLAALSSWHLFTGRSRNKRGIVLAIALPLVAVMLAISTVCLCFLLRRRRPAREPIPSYSTNNSGDIERLDSLLLAISTLRAATDSFAENNRLGEGGFGAVYKDNPVDRPMMSTVNIMLNSGTVSLQAPLKPVFFIPKSGYYSTVYSESYPTAFQSTGNVKSGAISPNEVSITEMEPR
ncbi:hypothetical protein HU200_051481 [Digitaria exilis]|uniref:Uncharacterized protein n=1 Tax=Digitaria exilis TaxID=1010633 RepID=A0A835AV86_9POAL|nr:hypothetical protein HU200_051481 [Digitaria exilis]